jgi:CBS domain-containing protein
MNLGKILVGSLLQEKDNSVYCTTVDSTVDAAIKEMNHQRIGSLMVTDAGYMVGIFTERDVLTRVVAADLDPKSTPIRDVMTVRFKSIEEDASVEDAMQLMKEYKIRHLPVLRGDKLLGMLSIGDVNGWLLKVNEIEAENLRRYMFEAYPS